MITLHERDLFIFDKLTRYRLTAPMILELSQTCGHPFTRLKDVQRRLKQLYQGHFVNRQPLLWNREYFYYLTRTAAQTIYGRDEFQVVKTSDALFGRLQEGQHRHEFMMSRFMTKFEVDCGQAGVVFPLFIRAGHFSVPVTWGTEKGLLKPDGTVLIRVDGHAHLLFIEADRSTEKVRTVRAEATNRKSFQQKIEKYSTFLKTGFPRHPLWRELGLSGFMVVTICKSRQRLTNLVRLAQDMGKVNLFRFIGEADYLTLDPQGKWMYQQAVNLVRDAVYRIPDRTTALLG